MIKKTLSEMEWESVYHASLSVVINFTQGDTADPD